MIKTAFNQLNNSSALILDQFAVQTGARARLSLATHISTKRSEQRTFIALVALYDFLNGDASVRLVTGHGDIFISSHCSISFETTKSSKYPAKSGISVDPKRISNLYLCKRETFNCVV